jgi:hypothetical protein
MNTKKAPSENLSLWQQAELESRAALEPQEPPLADESSTLIRVMSEQPDFMLHQVIDDEDAIVTPAVHYLPLKNEAGVIRPKILTDDTSLPEYVTAEALRFEGDSEPLYLVMSSKNSSLKHRYTIQGGLVSDYEDTGRDLNPDEIVGIEIALTALSERIQSDAETLKRQSLLRKIGGRFISHDQSTGMTRSAIEVAKIKEKESRQAERAKLRAKRRAYRQMQREIRRNSLGEVGTDV